MMENINRVMENINIIELVKIIVPSVISVLGFICTYHSMRRQFKNSIKQQLTEEQRKVYLDTYIDVEKVITTNELIFEPEYYDQLVSHKAKIKLAASNAVINAYGEYMKFVLHVTSQAREWILENHPESCRDNFEYVYDEYGNEQEISHISDDMYEYFWLNYEKYKKEQIPTEKEITKKVDVLLNAMRADLGNKKYVRKRNENHEREEN